MYSSNDEQLSITPRNVSQKPSEDPQLIIPSNLDPAVAKAMAQAMVAREQRLAATQVAECLVRVKELETSADVEITRLKEDGSTERCRITEEHQSQRFARWSDVKQFTVKEQSETRRAEVEMTELTKRQAVAAHERVEGVRIRAAASSSSFASFAVAAAAGALAAAGLTRRRHARKGRSVVWYLSMLTLAAASYRLWRTCSAILQDPQKFLALLLRSSWKAAVRGVTTSRAKEADTAEAASA
mmetsp:Transcript_76559/g.140166  ORF Transcript_76559/g.140166 Transcript_76559/m.140166 type:complete len:242 (+) Transcript_76559:75-800(+)